MELPTVQWYAVNGDRVEHLSEVKIRSDLGTEFMPDTAILRVIPDGKMAFISQRSNISGKDYSDILIADLTSENLKSLVLSKMPQMELKALLFTRTARWPLLPD